ncbi:MAG: hypothetical protein RIN56_16485, partial [Sporomusaceae bacterium]|nr:hypothetical protein [Sporomusaceae bacterium]
RQGKVYHRSFSTAANMQFYIATFLHFIVGADRDNTQQELEDKHVLFMTDDRDHYIDKLFARLGF